MAVKILSEFKKPHAIFDGKAFLKRPQLAIFPMQVIGIWSDIELGIAAVIGAMLKADAEIGLLMYRSVIGEGPKTAILNGIADIRLVDDAMRTLLKRIIAANRESKNQRNAFAHSIWGWSMTIPDGLLMTNPTNIAVHLAEALEKSRPLTKDVLPMPLELTQHTQVWFKEDFESAVSLAQDAKNRLELFRRLIDAPTDTKRMQQLLRLLPPLQSHQPP